MKRNTKTCRRSLRKVISTSSKSFFRILLSPDYRATILWGAFWALYLVYFIYALINPL